MNELGENVGQCGWPTVVRAGYYCSGVYIGKGLVLTSAHCLEGNNIPGGKVYFGESTQQTALEIDVVEAFRHPDGEPSTNVWGEPSYEGVDLAVCVLAEQWTGPATPVMRLGCESNWLNFAFFNLEGPSRPRMRAVGVGCNRVNYNSYPPCEISGIKRVWKATLDRNFPQVLYLGSYKLTHRVPPWKDNDPIEMGDSGGPLFVRMPDNTWRVIGILHGEVYDSELYWEPVPPFVDWIEDVTGRSIAKSPGGGFLRGEEETASWSDSCSTLSGQGQLCGGAPLIPPEVPGLGTEAAATNYVESWVIDGFPEAARFQAELKIAGEKLTIERGKIVGNPLEGLAFEIGCSEKLRKRGVKTVCEGPVLTLNARLEIHRIEIPGGSLRRVGRFRPEDETPRNSEGFFLDGRWEACSPK